MYFSSNLHLSHQVIITIALFNMNYFWHNRWSWTFGSNFWQRLYNLEYFNSNFRQCYFLIYQNVSVLKLDSRGNYLYFLLSKLYLPHDMKASVKSKTVMTNNGKQWKILWGNIPKISINAPYTALSKLLSDQWQGMYNLRFSWSWLWRMPWSRTWHSVTL
jgi:hypothetical protein